MKISPELIKELREKSGAGIMDCKKALEECQGNMDKAIDYLRVMGLAASAKKAGRITKEGLINAYIHPGSRIGVLVEINCETDFVARTNEFKEFVKDISMQIAATNPLYISRDNVPLEVIEKEGSILKEQALASGKSEKVVDEVVDGRMEKYFSENCLLDQPFIKDPSIKIKDLVAGKIALLKENISIRRFIRYQLGENPERREEGDRKAQI